MARLEVAIGERIIEGLFRTKGTVFGECVFHH